jgi:hypothetical protein
MAEHGGLNKNEKSSAAPAREIPNGGGFTPDGITPRVKGGKGIEAPGARSGGTRRR